MPWGSSSERLRKFVSYRRTDPENVSTVIERHRRPTTASRGRDFNHYAESLRARTHLARIAEAAASTCLAGRIEGGAGGVDAWQIVYSPLSQRDDRALQRLSQRGEFVVHPGWNSRRHLATYHAVALQSPEGERQHSLRHTRDGPVESSENRREPSLNVMTTSTLHLSPTRPRISLTALQLSVTWREPALKNVPPCGLSSSAPIYPRFLFVTTPLSEETSC
jgi:hypothetical protein